MGELELVNIDNPRKYYSDLRDCLTCIKYLNEYDIYAGERIGILRESIPGNIYFPKGSYVLFMENKNLGMGTYIVEKPKTEQEIKESIFNNTCQGFMLGFISFTADSIPKIMLEEAIIKFK